MINFNNAKIGEKVAKYIPKLNTNMNAVFNSKEIKFIESLHENMTLLMNCLSNTNRVLQEIMNQCSPQKKVAKNTYKLLIKKKDSIISIVSNHSNGSSTNQSHLSSVNTNNNGNHLNNHNHYQMNGIAPIQIPNINHINSSNNIQVPQQLSNSRSQSPSTSYIMPSPSQPLPPYQMAQSMIPPSPQLPTPLVFYTPSVTKNNENAHVSFTPRSARSTQSMNKNGNNNGNSNNKSVFTFPTQPIAPQINATVQSNPNPVMVAHIQPRKQSIDTLSFNDNNSLNNLNIVNDNSNINIGIVKQNSIYDHGKINKKPEIVRKDSKVFRLEDQKKWSTKKLNEEYNDMQKQLSHLIQSSKTDLYQ